MARLPVHGRQDDGRAPASQRPPDGGLRGQHARRHQGLPALQPSHADRAHLHRAALDRPHRVLRAAARRRVPRARRHRLAGLRGRVQHVLGKRDLDPMVRAVPGADVLRDRAGIARRPAGLAGLRRTQRVRRRSGSVGVDGRALDRPRAADPALGPGGRRRAGGHRPGDLESDTKSAGSASDLRIPGMHCELIQVGGRATAGPWQVLVSVPVSVSPTVESRLVALRQRCTDSQSPLWARGIVFSRKTT